MNPLKQITTITLLLLAGLTHAPAFGRAGSAFTPLRSDEETNCTLMHSGSFSYANTEEAITVEVTASTLTEHYEGGYSLVSAIVWESDCSYTATIQSVNVPDFPYGVGDQMQVIINEVLGNEVHYTSTIDGESWEGVLVKE